MGPCELFLRGAIEQLLFQLTALEVMLVYCMGRLALCVFDRFDVGQLDLRVDC